jgi:predicted TIM-barrel fold metal-dependent hydrolase
LSQQNPGVLHANVPGLERLLAHNRDARIVLQHVGRDNIGHLNIELLRRLLSEHSNLYLAVQVSTSPTLAGQDPLMPNRIIGEDFQIKPEWLKFFHDFPDRFVVGTDEFSSPVESEKGPFAATWRIFESQLPPVLRAKICGENAARIYALR